MKEIINIKPSQPKKTTTKEYPKTRSPQWIRSFYNGDRQNQENRQ